MKTKITEFRKKLKMTQQALADSVNVTRQTIISLESGKYNPSLNLCIKIAKVLDKTLDDLFWE